LSEVKDLYAILGVLPDAEPDVLKAVYLALAKKYHPDTSGSSEHEEKLKEINAAYEILRDPVQRREYDATRSQQNDDTGQYEPDVDDEDLTAEALQSDWEFAVEYRPELGDLLRSVATISPTLSIVFQSTILNRRSFDNASLIADELVAGFMRRYFGRNESIVAFAKELIRLKEKSAAKELNKAARIFGDSIDAAYVTAKITNKYLSNRHNSGAGSPHNSEAGSPLKYHSPYKGFEIYNWGNDKFFVYAGPGIRVANSLTYLNLGAARAFVDEVTGSPRTSEYD
jgi:curved DNA-binding protein CbpA